MLRVAMPSKREARLWHRTEGRMRKRLIPTTPCCTYLLGEENWAGYFTAADMPTAHERRWGISRNNWNRWPEHDSRFDTVRNPNEPNRFGWVVEVDPMGPTNTPVKRTAIGRAAHEGAWVAVTQDNRAVVYSGEGARFEYIYKFVSREKIALAGNVKTAAQANATLPDHGTLFVARFDADGSGRWPPLVHGSGPLTATNGFAHQSELLIKARQASDLLDATKMNRPEWLAIDETSGWGEFARMGNNALMACNPVTGEVRRFLVGPVNCELTGAAWAPDSRLRSSTLVIRKDDGGVIGSQPPRPNGGVGHRPAG